MLFGRKVGRAAGRKTRVCVRCKFRINYPFEITSTRVVFSSNRPVLGCFNGLQSCFSFRTADFSSVCALLHAPPLSLCPSAPSFFHISHTTAPKTPPLRRSTTPRKQAVCCTAHFTCFKTGELLFFGVFSAVDEQAAD